MRIVLNSIHNLTRCNKHIAAPPTSGHDKEEDSSQPLIGQLQLVIDALLMSLNDGDTNGRLIITSDDDDDMQLNLLALKGEP
mmetsp:Transcript_28674/g.24506  ORF Transcript_28674/g.24506 Transcript_28674/m.24506 type:complete len:82 (-) Transcript_28674:382-627(-)